MGGIGRYRFLRSVLGVVSTAYKLQFSQFGEDALIYRQFRRHYVGTYLDIGAYHPFKFSNTARLWMMGWNGVNVDANKVSVERLSRLRRGDRNIWAAVVPAAEKETRKFVDFAGGGSINALGHVANAQSGMATTSVPAICLDDLFGYFDRPVDFMNVDIEGLDEAIVADAAFAKLSPRLLAIEQRGESIADVLNRPATALIRRQGYELIARCELTSIFRRDDWET